MNWKRWRWVHKLRVAIWMFDREARELQDAEMRLMSSDPLAYESYREKVRPRRV